MKICPDCGESLIRLNDTLFQCPTTALYYPQHRGRLGIPLINPPGGAKEEQQEQIVSTPKINPFSMTDKEMYAHPKFLQFCNHQYSELPAGEVIRQIRQSDSATRRIVRSDFYQWLQTH